ncbi:MAG: hypothetical protein BEN19_00990 [Epulopiscium sp. Nuni2H_MBin003]|nr:MAG: hypothetical protein BEN19_00990 [Epulopiscium sp. Nuni2H_MBin003]
MLKLKTIMLSFFILLSIIQTIHLWLGGSLSHIFFEETAVSTLSPISPKNIWVNTGGNYTHSYLIPNEQQEYEDIIAELQQALLNYTDFTDAQYKTQDISQLFNQQGLIYEYSLPVTIDEIVGKPIPLNYNYKINTVFIKISDSNIADNNIYFINYLEDYYIEIILQDGTYEFTNIYSLFNTNDTKYQPSIKDIKSQFIQGNVFLANISNTLPIIYTNIIFKNELQQDNFDIQNIERYIDHFFEKPIMKEISLLLGGTIEFIESQKNLIRYSNRGTIQYINLSPNTFTTPMSKLEGYNIVMDFINSTDSIHPTIKNRLYVSDIKIEQEAYVYYLDIIKNGHTIILNENLQTALEINSAIEIKVKNHNIIEGKWITYSLEEEYSYIKYQFTEGYSVPIDKMYSMLQAQNVEQPKFENVELVYELSSINKGIPIKWGVKYNGRWHFP